KIREPHFIIVHNNEMKVGLLVDRIAGIVSLDETDTDIKDEPIDKTELEIKLEPYISDVSISEEKPLYVVDVDKLLSDPRMKREAENA
ncbi:MAG: chemotaxis protein CheW, partial [Deltaproteobacteria bacterium]|nr:chemotaxis protein CheW [Deltaproteobacteria bacterium]